MAVEHCGAKNRSGGTCGKPAGWGTPRKSGRCKLHGGATRTHEVKAQREEAVKAVAVYGLPREVDPHTALLEELHRTAGHVAWLGRIIGAGVLPPAESPTGKKRTVKLDQATFASGDAPSVWVELYHRERKHFADVAKTCIAVGIEERRVQIAEQQGQVLADVIRGVLSDLGVLDHPEAATVVRRHLTLVSSAA